MPMEIIDAHCDALSKLYLHPRLDFYQEEAGLDVSFPRMQRGGVKIQCFAIYVSEQIQLPKYEHILQMVDIFYDKIIRSGRIQVIKHVNDLQQVLQQEVKGAILTLEGVDALAGNLALVRNLYQIGVRIMGITWNYANWAADGVMEPRKGGFTLKGKNLIWEMEKLGIIVDVSHLSVNGFWELVDMYGKPFIASHSNSIEQCPHPRNLSNDQIKAVIAREGQIGLTFVPYFVKKHHPVQIRDLLTHIDHVCALGGELNIGFGSDFDGIDQWIQGLEHAGQYGNLVEVLCKNYKSEQVSAFLYGNWKRFLLNNLPLN
jgi:membrane dipeptidase